MSMSRLTISELFGPTIQGEGVHIGKPTVFVRTGGCDYRCSWCDTLYAVLPAYKAEWRPMDTESVFAEIQRLSPTPILVTLSGGNPAIQPLGDLIDLGHAHGYTYCMETQGSITRAWMSRLDSLTVSPKPPSSGMTTRFERLAACVGCNEHVTLKIVIFDEADYQYARDIATRFPAVPVFLQPGNATPPQVGAFDREAVLEKTRWLIIRANEDGWHEVTILPQLHTLLWENARGV